MNKKPIQPFLRERYKKLTKAEEALREKLERLYVAHSAELTELLTSQQPPTGHAALMARMTPKEREYINYAKHRSLLDFDELNKRDYVHARVALSEYDLADREYKLIREHLLYGIAATWGDLEYYLDMIDNRDIVKISKEILDKEYPGLKSTLYKNATQRAYAAVKDWERGIIRGEDPAANAETIAYDNLKRERNASDRIIYTEGTRTTNDTVVEILRDAAQFVRSVTVKDGKACDTCRDIEREQAQHPVPIDDAQAGVTIPPFHPYCRCHMEVIYRDEDQT